MIWCETNCTSSSVVGSWIVVGLVSLFSFCVVNVLYNLQRFQFVWSLVSEFEEWRQAQKKRRLVYLSAGCYWRYCSKIIEKWQKKTDHKKYGTKKIVASEKCHCFECVFRRIGSKQTNSVSKRKENLLSKMLDLMLNLEFVTIFFLFRLLVEFVMCIFAFRKRNKSTKE